MSNRQLLSIIVSGLLPTMALCQIPFSTPVDGSTPPAFAPGSATGSYALSGFEYVNLFNGALNFTLPLVELKGRGKTGTPLVLPIERKWYVLVGDNNGATIRSAVPDIVNTLGSPGKLEFRETGRDLFTNCTSPMYRETLTRIIFQRGDGPEMEFVDTKTGGGPQTTMEINNGAASGTFTCPSTADTSRGRVWVTRDGSFATLILDSALTDGTSYNNAPPVPSGGGPNAYIFFKDGTRYKFTNQVLVEIRDRNGNRTEFVYTSLRLTSMRDSIGRQVTILYDQVVDTTNPARRDVYDLIQYPSYGGGQSKAIKVHYCALDPRADDPVAPTCPNYTGITTKTFANLFGLNGMSLIV